MNGAAGTLFREMTVRDLREKYLRFFESKGHQRFPAGSLVPVDVTGRVDESLLFNGAGMIQFKPFFRGVARPDHPRLITCQPCVRTNDIEEVGDDTHLSFFEMLGNFSFGDYFKKEVIAFSWEFMTGSDWLNLDPRRLSFTIFEQDDEAYKEWSNWIATTGLDPANRIVRLDEESNYWPAGAFTKGPPGPCGPNSEMFYWVSPEEPPTGPYSREDWIRDEADRKWVEFWNDVFIQYEWQGTAKADGKGYDKVGMPELPFRSIDTGMGLERSALVLGGYKSVYDTDVFQPVFQRIDALRTSSEVTDATHRARRIIADHLRTAVFCIAEGILPGNNGRGYVLRRLIRRATLQGQRILGFNDPFLANVFEGLLESMGEFYTHLVDNRETIAETLRTEELLFRRTLASGSDLLQKALAALSPGAILTGDVAFRLYDTFGFPLEVTQEIATEAGIALDLDGYEVALKEAQVRSRGAQERESVYGGVTGAEEVSLPEAPESTEFLGYDSVEASGRIVRVRRSGPGRIRLALDRTAFYAESGGQTGDQGTLTIVGGARDGHTFEVLNTTKQSGIFWHEVLADSWEEWLGLTAFGRVTSTRRDRIRRNHTATHLLQAALRQIVGTHVTQAGSYVGPENLRFDFTHSKALTPGELESVERLVNAQALANTLVITYVDLPIAEARTKGAMALFGEKYGDKVRMVEIGDFSRELCGGIHVRSTGEVGLFRIVSESSAASGVRRIEAITGESAYESVVSDSARLREAANLLKSSPKELVGAIERTLESLKDEKKKREKAEMSALAGGSEDSSVKNFQIGSVTLWVRNFGEADPKVAASAVDNEAAGKANQVTLAVVQSGGKLTFIAKAGPEAVSAGAHAGNLLRDVSKIAEGGGGGRPDFATAGGKNPEKAEAALNAAPEILSKMIN